MAHLIDQAKDRLEQEADAYRHGEDRPLGGYVKVLATYSTVVAGLSALVAARRKPLPERPAAGDLALVALATAKVARLVTKDPVTSPLRAPFTRYDGVSGPATLKEEVRGHGVKHSIGELLTCPFCLSQWVATGFTFGLLFAPRTTRQVAGTFSALAVSDALQLGRTLLEKAATA